MSQAHSYLEFAILMFIMVLRIHFTRSARMLCWQIGWPRKTDERIRNYSHG